jgi:hypothetical protein
MPAVTDTNVAPVAGLLTPDKIAMTQPVTKPVGMRSAIVDSRFQSLAGLITYIEGTPWVVQWFSGVLGTNDELTPLQPGQAPIYNQYIKINGLEIRVQEPLSQTTDTATNEISIVGSAACFPHFIPNYGDMFLADIGDGREAMFMVSSAPERKSLFSDSAYLINYSLVDVGEGVAARRANLEQKVQATRVFRKNLLQDGKNPVLIEQDSLNYDRLGQRYHNLVRNYLAEFYNTESKTLEMPHVTDRVYDHYLTRFILDTVDTSVNNGLKFVRTLNVGGAESMDVFTVWDMLRETDLSLVPLLQQRMWLAGTEYFTRQASFASIRYSSLTSTVYPYDRMPDSPLAAVGGVDPYPLSTVVYPHLDHFDSALTIGNITIPQPPMIHPIGHDTSYVFSSAFYTNTSPGQSALELIVRRALNNETVDARWVLQLCDSVNTWRPLDRFYYIPVLLVIIKATQYRS